MQFEQAYPQYNAFIDKITLALDRSIIIGHEYKKKHLAGIDFIDKGPVVYLVIHAEYLNFNIPLYFQLMELFHALITLGILELSSWDLMLEFNELTTIPSLFQSTAFHYPKIKFAEMEVAWDIEGVLPKQVIKQGSGMYKYKGTFYSKDNKKKLNSSGAVKARKRSTFTVYDKAKKLGLTGTNITRLEIRLYSDFFAPDNRQALRNICQLNIFQLINYFIPMLNKKIRSINCLDAFRCNFMNQILPMNPVFSQILSPIIPENLGVSMNTKKDDLNFIKENQKFHFFYDYEDNPDYIMNTQKKEQYNN